MFGLSFMELRVLNKRVNDGLIGEGCGFFWFVIFLLMSVFFVIDFVNLFIFII